MRKRPLAGVIERPSPNFSDRKGNAVQFLILHYTAMDTAEAAIQRLCDPQSQVSAHYVVDEQGVIYRLVAEQNKAWHAGISYWDGHSDLNFSSVGIEIANPGTVQFPKAQMEAVIALSKDIVKRHGIRTLYTIGHSDIAPDRKPDPGYRFDWPLLATNSLGIWPVPTAQDYKTSSKWTDSDVHNALVRFGYKASFDLKTLLPAFQRHFEPDVWLNHPDEVGTASAETKAKLACLVRRKAISDGLRKRSSTRRNSGS